MTSCIMLCYYNESHDTYVFYNQGWEIFQNHMDKRLSCFWVYGCYRATNVLKSINILLIDEWYIGIFAIDI
jgi:hypothetical protein